MNGFLCFLCVAAARSAQLRNIAELSRDVDVAPNTVKRWVSILQASGIAFLVEAYHST